MLPKSKSNFRRKKNFLLHTLPKLRRSKEWRRFPVVQLNLIEGKIDYSSDAHSSQAMRVDEIEYINIFHKTNDQPLILGKRIRVQSKKKTLQ